jgi:two-component system response regulator YesN
LQSSIIKKLGFSNVNCIFKIKKGNTLEEKFYKVHECSLETGTHSLKTLAELYGLFAMIEEVRFGSKSSNLQERYVREALTFIENNIATADVQSTANDCSISPTYLTRVCKKILGLSLKDLITLTRLQVACNYLRYTRKPIKEVGAQVGYPQRKYFTRVFKSVFDVTPTQYREKN